MRNIKKLTCKERDAIIHATGRYEGWSVYSSCTDPDGEFGEPRIDTTWGKGNQRIQDIRYPNPDGGKDAKPCEHFQWTEEDEDED